MLLNVNLYKDKGRNILLCFLLFFFLISFESKCSISSNNTARHEGNAAYNSRLKGTFNKTNFANFFLKEHINMKSLTLLHLQTQSIQMHTYFIFV